MIHVLYSVSLQLVINLKENQEETMVIYKRDCYFLRSYERLDLMEMGVINLSLSVVSQKAIGSSVFPTFTTPLLKTRKNMTSKLVASILVTYMNDMSIIHFKTK